MELHIRDVSKSYSNGVQALKDVTLTVPAGMYGEVRQLQRYSNHRRSGRAVGVRQVA